MKMTHKAWISFLLAAVLLLQLWAPALVAETRLAYGNTGYRASIAALAEDEGGEPEPEPEPEPTEVPTSPPAPEPEPEPSPEPTLEPIPDSGPEEAEDEPEDTGEPDEPEEDIGGLVSAHLLVEELFANGEMELPEPDGSFTVNSNTKTLSGILQINTTEQRDWYFGSAEVGENSLPGLALGGAFAKGTMGRAEVDAGDPTKVHFEIDGIYDPVDPESLMHKGRGFITVRGEDNCYGQDLTADFHIDDLRFSPSESGMTRSAANENEPADEGELRYDLQVRLMGGRVAGALAPDDISFSGSLENAAIRLGPVIDDDEAGFTLSIAALRGAAGNHAFHGNLILAGDTLAYENGKLLHEKTHLYLTDPDLAPPEDGPENGENGLYDLELAMQGVNSPNPEAFVTMFGFFAASFPGLEFFGPATTSLTAFLKAVGVFQDPVQKALELILKALAEINSKLAHLENMLDAATKQIVGEITKSELSGRINALQKDMSNMDVKYSVIAGTALAPMAEAAEIREKGQEIPTALLSRLDVGLRNVYNTDFLKAGRGREGGNFDYLDMFRHVNMEILGHTEITITKNSFANYQGYCVYAFNWNSQTFVTREKYNEYIYSVFCKDFTALYAAITYDYAKNNAKIPKLEAEIEAVNGYLALNQEALAADGRPLAEILADLEEELEDVRYRRDTSARYCGVDPQSKTDLTNNIEYQKKLITAAREASRKDLAAEIKIFEGGSGANGKIWSYRLNRYVSAILDGYSARDVVVPTYYRLSGDKKTVIDEYNMLFTRGMDLDHKLEKHGLPLLSEQDHLNLINYCTWRGITVYDDLCSARFFVHDMKSGRFCYLKDYPKSQLHGLLYDQAVSDKQTWTGQVYCDGFAEGYIDFTMNQAIKHHKVYSLHYHTLSTKHPGMNLDQDKDMCGSERIFIYLYPVN